MGFYSSIQIASSHRNIVKDDLVAELWKRGIIVDMLNDREWLVKNEIADVFEGDGSRRRENKDMFIPGCVSIHENLVQFCGLDTKAASIQSFSISFHGPGYFYPIDYKTALSEFMNNSDIKRMINWLNLTYPAGLDIPSEYMDLFSELSATSHSGGWSCVICEA